MKVNRIDESEVFISRAAHTVQGIKDDIVVDAMRKAGIIPTNSNLKKITCVTTPCGTENYFYNVGSPQMKKIISLLPSGKYILCERRYHGCGRLYTPSSTHSKISSWRPK